MNFIECFERGVDGTWTCCSPVTLNHPNGRMQVTVGTSFAPGSSFMGVDVALWLEQAARARK